MALSVSIIVCNFNYEEFVADAVQSALSQTFRPLEVIVVDDGSTDASLDRLQQFRDNPIFRLFVKQNGGQVSAYNTGFELATGDVVIFLDSDDLLLPDALEHIVAAFLDPSVVKFHWRMRLIDTLGNPIGGYVPSVLDAGDLRDRLLEHGVLYNSAPGSGNAYRRSALKLIFPLPEDSLDRHGADFFTIYGVSLLGQVCVAKQMLGAYRIHAIGDDVRSALAFGNAAKSVDEPARTVRRSIRFQHWLAERLSLDFVETNFIDFSMLKSEYALSVMGCRWGLERLRAANKLFPRFCRGVRSRPDFGWVKRSLFYLWATFIPIFPDLLAGRLAAWVSNPGARPKIFTSNVK